jgi:methylglutaconyl-CoA hydratase
MSTEAPLLLEVDGNVATIRLNRPKVGNSLSPDLLVEMKRFLLELKENCNIRVIVLTAVGKFFCTGMDLSSSNQKKMGAVDAVCFHCFRYNYFLDLSHVKKTSIEMYELLFNYPKPIISRINGPALAGGWGLLFCTDIRIAASSAWFCFAEVRRGLVSFFSLHTLFMCLLFVLSLPLVLVSRRRYLP